VSAGNSSSEESGFPAPRFFAGIHVSASLSASRLAATALLACMLASVEVQAHDPSAYGGLFRSRNFGGAWLNADVGLFLGGSVSVAVNPSDGNHLLLGTDTALLSTRNAGREWAREAPEKLFGAVFAVTFLPDGKSALAVVPGGVFRWNGADWQQAQAPSEAAPARAIALGAQDGRMYLIGRRELYRSDDAGQHWRRVEHNLPDQPEFTALAVAAEAQETLYAIVDGQVMTSTDSGARWQARTSGLPAAPAEALTLDPAAPGRLWVAAGARLYRSDDAGAQWSAFGARLPEADCSVRGIAADSEGATIVVTTHRGLFRSPDGAKSWALVEGNLPVHLEARPLVRDPTEPNTLYAGFSLMPYAEVWRVAVEGGNLLGRLDAISLAGGLAFFLLVIALGALAAGWLARRRNRADPPVTKSRP
jgi:photosystem II stability/assembly factor-like uncharacterized protein